MKLIHFTSRKDLESILQNGFNPPTEEAKNPAHQGMFGQESKDLVSFTAKKIVPFYKMRNFSQYLDSTLLNRFNHWVCNRTFELEFQQMLIMRRSYMADVALVIDVPNDKIERAFKSFSLFAVQNPYSPAPIVFTFGGGIEVTVDRKYINELILSGKYDAIIEVHSLDDAKYLERTIPWGKVKLTKEKFTIKKITHAIHWTLFGGKTMKK